MSALTGEERKAIAALKRLAANWPASLWLFYASGFLHVMKKDIKGEKAMDGDGYDQDYVVATVGIEGDGGDW